MQLRSSNEATVGDDITGMTSPQPLADPRKILAAALIEARSYRRLDRL
jgi:hypothetical protein